MFPAQYFDMAESYQKPTVENDEELNRDEDSGGKMRFNGSQANLLTNDSKPKTRAVSRAMPLDGSQWRSK